MSGGVVGAGETEVERGRWVVGGDSEGGIVGHVRDHSKFAALRATSSTYALLAALAALECKPPPAPACSNPALRRSHGLQTRAGVRTVPPPTGALDSDRTHRHLEDAPRLPTFAAMAHAPRRDGLDTVVFIGTSGDDLTSRRHPPRPWSHTGLRRLSPPLAPLRPSPQTGSSRFHGAYSMPCRTSFQGQKTSPLCTCSYIFRSSCRPSSRTPRLFSVAVLPVVANDPPHAERLVRRCPRRCFFRRALRELIPSVVADLGVSFGPAHSSWYLHWRSTTPRTATSTLAATATEAQRAKLLHHAARARSCAVPVSSQAVGG